MRPDPSYQQTIDYLFALQKHGVKLGLANSRTLMELSGNPHHRFRTIHVAGTNGKGSTSAFIASMLTAAGYRVGLYTSPHLVSFTERIRIDGTAISEARVVDLARRVREGYEGAARRPMLNPTFFEVTTAMAFACFAEEAVDVAVIEVGMGGKLDATNVITPLVSVITTIDLEHTEYLGGTLELIAAEKAGIIKPGVPVVTGARQPETRTIIEQTAAAAGSPVHLLGRDFRPEAVTAGQEQRFDFVGIRGSLEGCTISLRGRYQIDNACLALAAVECAHEAGLPVPEEARRMGLARARWEGRLELVSRRPDVYLDGAHNPASAAMLAGEVRELKKHYRRLVLVIGILADKDVTGIMTALAPLADRMIVTRPAYSRALDLAALAAEARLLHGNVDAAERVDQAIMLAKGKAGPDDLILATGSLYVVGDARAALLGEGARPSPFSGLKG